MKLSKDENGVDINQSIYKSIIKNLLYLVSNRPSITFIVGVCDMYQAKSKASHLIQVKRILKYISETYEYGILYYHDTNSILVGYYDVDWVGSTDDRKVHQVDVSFLEII